MIKLIVIKTLLVSSLLIDLTITNPVPEDPSVDWSTRISDNVESIININGPTKFNFDDSSEETDSTFSKREASPISGPLDAPLGWGARIESSSSAVGSVDVSPSSSSSGAGAVVAGGGGGGGGSGGGVGVDNKQKVDWALNPGDNKKLYSTNDAPDVIEQKKEETLPLAPESSKQSEESNPDPYKNILPAVLTGKRRLAEGDKPVQLSPSSPSSSSVSSGADVSSTVDEAKEKVSPSVFSLVDNKGHSVGQVYPYDKPVDLKPSDGKSIPQHVYTEDQFPSVITIKGREYLVIPHKSNTVRPLATQTLPGSSSWFSEPVSIQSGQFSSPFFPSSSSAYQPIQVGHGSKSNQSSPPASPVAEVPSGGHHQQFVSSFTGGYPGQSSYEFGHSSFPQHPGSSSFTWKSRYPIYHSSVFTNPNVQQQQQSSPPVGQISPNSIPSVFSSFFPQYGQYPSSPQVSKNFQFFTPPSHTVSISSTGGPSTTQGEKVVVASPPSFISTPGSSVPASPQGEVKGNPTFVSDPSFSPKLQDPVQSSPSIVGGGGGGGVAVTSQQESFVTKPMKPESNLHAPPQIPTWNPFGFSVVAGSYPVQSPSPSVSGSSSSPPLSSSSSTSSSKTHVESPVTVTVDTKFPPQQLSSSSSSGNNGGVKGGSSSPSVTVGSFNVDSAADQPVAKGQPQPQPQQTQQQYQQQGGVAGETVVPTTIDAKNQFIPNSPFLSSSGYFVSSSSVNQLPSSSVYPTFSTSVSPSSSTPSSPGSSFIPQLGFTDQQQFFAPPWQSSGYNYPIPASSPSPYYDQVNPVTSSWDYPFYHHQETFYNQKGLNQPDFDLNQVPQQRF